MQTDLLRRKPEIMALVSNSLDRLLSDKRSASKSDRLIAQLACGVAIGAHATATITHRRPYDKDERTGRLIFRGDDRDIVAEDRDVGESFGAPQRMISLLDAMKGGTLSEDQVINLIINAGRIYMHNQCYAASGQGVGFIYVACSNDVVSGNETATSTTLSTEIAANGLTRAIGAHTPPTGSGNVSTVAKTFTATGTQSARKSALFTASSAGTMQHVLEYAAQKNLVTDDTLAVTFSITLA